MNPRTRIVHVVTGLEVGGAEIMLCRVIERLDRTRFECSIVSLASRGPLAERIEAAGVPLTCLNMRGPFALPFGLWKLRGILRREQPDLVQTWMYHADFLGGLAALLAGRIPVVWNVQHGTHCPRGIKASTRALTWLLAKLSRLLPRAIISCSKASIDHHASQGYDAARMVWVCNGAELDVFKPDPAAAATLRRSLGIPEDAQVIGAAGRFHPQKDYPTLFEAALSLQGDFPELHFVLCGSQLTPENPVVRDYLDRSPAPDRFHLLGVCSDMAKIYPAFSIFTLCSAFGEGFPLALGEAMASGVPCVATDTGDSAILVGDTGRVTTTGDITGIAAAWKTLLTLPPDELDALGRRARRRVEDQFSLSGSIRSYEDLYSNLAGRPEPAPDAKHAECAVAAAGVPASH